MKTTAIVPAATAMAFVLLSSARAQPPHTMHTDASPPVSYARGILPPGPGNGFGFRNGNPDGYGWWDAGSQLPIGADRTAEYYFRRYFAVPAPQAFLPSYYNPIVTRGQRYIPFAGCGGCVHPMSGPPTGSAITPARPYQATLGRGPSVTVPPFTGRTEAPPVPPGGSGLTP